MVDSALAHFFMKQLWKPMSLEIRIVPEFQNRRNMTLVVGDKESIDTEKNKVIDFMYTLRPNHSGRMKVHKF